MRNWFLPLLAIAGLGFAVNFVVQARQEPPKSSPLVSPPTQADFARTIAGAGIIEARLENIPVGSPVQGVVWEVNVRVKDRVKKGDPLFRIDDRELKAELSVREANLQSAIATAKRAEAAPNSGDVATYEAAVDEARARLNGAEATSGRTKALYDKQMGTASDYDNDRYAYQAARATLTKSQADLQRLKVTWDADKQVARAAVAMASSQIESTRIQLERLVVRALADGEILQVNIRPGQLAASLWNQGLVVIGDSNRLHVRVDIDENDVPLFDPTARAVATLKGRPGVKFDLVPFKVEPYIIPKRSLTGDTSERVDTRVLQVVYTLPEKPPIPLYIGQQMDAYIEAARPPTGVSLDTDLRRQSPFDPPSAVAPATTPADPKTPGPPEATPSSPIPAGPVPPIPTR